MKLKLFKAPPNFSGRLRIPSWHSRKKCAVVAVVQALACDLPSSQVERQAALSFDAQPAQRHPLTVEQRSSGISLLDLPNELLASIIECLDSPKQLYAIAIINRRLRDCTLPVYYARNGISEAVTRKLDPQIVVFDFDSNLQETSPSQNLTLISGVIPSLHCAFHFPDHVLLWEVLGLESVLDGVSEIHEIVVELHDVYVLKPPLEPSGEVVGLEWALRLQALLMRMVNKSCFELTIRQGTLAGVTRPPSSPAKRPRHQPSTTSIKAKQITNSRENRTLKKRKRSRNPLAATQNEVKTLTFSAPMLLRPPFRNGTIALLNASSLDTLSLSAIDLTSSEWSVVLRALTLPSLSTLSLLCCDIAFTDLASFLLRHKEVTYLQIEHFDVLSSKNYLPISALPQLTTLIAPLDYVTHFLTPSGALPKLVHLTITSSIALNSSLAGIEAGVASVAERISSFPDLTLRLCLLRAEEPTSYFLHPKIRPGNFMRDFRITELEIVGAWYARSQFFLYDPEFSITRWLGKFPYLRRVSFIEFRGLEKMFDRSKAEFISSIGAHCPTVEVVAIDGVMHTIPEWQKNLLYCTCEKCSRRQGSG